MAPRWTNISVQQFARGGDPIAAIVQRARALTLQMIEEGWPGPPYDPQWVATLLGVEVVPVADAPDARAVPTGEGPFGVRIEYNPDRPASRRRFSLAHELGHLLFDDVAEVIRNRAAIDRARSDDWQLELLCNLAAAEIVMPVGSFEELRAAELDMGSMVRLRRELDVSFEALLLRIARLSDHAVAAFAVSRVDPGRPEPLRLDYTFGSRGWEGGLPRRGRVPPEGLIDCTAVGFTSGAEAVSWPGLDGPARMHCVGVPPFPGHRWPRILGLLEADRIAEPARLRTVFGDATAPMGPPPWVIAHIVNDRARAWHGGFAAALRHRYPQAQAAFIEQLARPPALGTNIVSQVDPDTFVVSMTAQAGYGPSKATRLRYQALRVCLQQLAEQVRARGASVHIPRIGTGQAKGRWEIVRGLIDEELVSQGHRVTVYELPPAPEASAQQELAL